MRMTLHSCMMEPFHTLPTSQKTYFENIGITVMQWPSTSPNLNPIENLWGIIVQKLYENQKQYDNTVQPKAEIITV